MRFSARPSSDSSETLEVITIKLGTHVIASDMRMYQVSNLFTLTFIQGHIDINHENNMIKVSLIQKLYKQCPSSLQ